MAQIELGIDIDSRDVVQADTAIDRLTEAVRGLERASGNLAGAAQRSDAGIRKVADATRQAETRTQAAIGQYQKLHAVWLSLAGIAGGVLAGGLLRTADAYTEITNKLRVVSSEQTNVNALFDQLLDVANRTRQPIDAIAQLYQRAALAANELGASQEQLIQFTENVGKALALQGGSAAAASGALLQLSQALGGGIVRAEEFNSILEGAFPIAQAAARGIDEAGGSVAKLRTLVIEGKVSSDAFFQALLSQTKELEEAFARTTPTIAGAFTVMQNNMLALVGGASETTGAMGAIARAIIVVADNLERLIVYAGTAAALFAGRVAAGLVASAVAAGSLSGALVVLRGALIRTGIGALIVGAGELVFQFTQLVTATGGWGNALALLGEVALGVWNGIITSAGAIPPALSAMWGQVRVHFLEMVQSLTITWSNFLNSLGLEGIAAGVAEFASKVGDSIVAADAQVASAAETAKTQLVAGFDQAVASVAKLQASVASTEANLNAGAGAAAGMGGALGAAAGSADDLAGGASKAAGGASEAAKAAEEMARAFERATDILREQQRAHDDVLAKLRGAKVESTFVEDEMRKIVEALEDSGASLDDFLKTVGLTRGAYAAMLRDTEKFTKELEKQEALSQTIADSFSALGKGILQISTSTGGIKDALGGIAASITDTLQGPFVEAMDDVFKGLGDRITKAMQGFGGVAGKGLLSPAAVSGIGSGLGMAAAGALQGSSQAIGAGIGQAAGTALGSVVGPLLGLAGPVGAIIGGIGGSLLGGLFGGGDDAPTVQAAGAVFQGTPFERNVGGRFYTQEEGKTGALALVQAGLNDLLRNFNDVVTEISRTLVSMPEEFRLNLRPIRDNLGGRGSEDFDFGDVAKVQQMIAGTLSDTIYSNGGETEKLAQEIEKRVGEVMDLVIRVATAGLPALTEAQKQYRIIGEQFDEENKAILEALGFTAEQIQKARHEAETDLRRGFNMELVQSIVDAGQATKPELQKWREMELKELQERREQAIRTAQEIGGSVKLVQSAFRAEQKNVQAEFAEMMAGLVKTVEETASNMERLSFIGSALNEMIEGGNVNRLPQWLRVNKAILELQRKDAVAEAKRLGVDVSAVNAFYHRKLILLEKEYQERRLGEVASNMERLSFVGGALDELVQAGNTNRLEQWLRVNRALLELQRKEAVAEARRLGVDVTAVNALYHRKELDLIKQYHDLRQAKEREHMDMVLNAWTERLSGLQNRLNDLESQRSSVLQELAQRADQARQAEQALADARAGIIGGDLNPGGPMDQFRALQRQFSAAIALAQGGDADAASRAGGLASSLLQAGRGVFASGTAYADLFRVVNAQLLAAQRGFDNQADQIDATLTSEKFVETTERSTKALLSALGALNAGIEKVEKAVTEQTKRIDLANQRNSVARAS